MSTKQTYLLGSALAILLLCVGAGLFGYYRILPRVQKGATAAVEKEIAFQLEHSMQDALKTHQTDPCLLELSPHDIDISSRVTSTGERRVDVVNSNATLSNVVIEVHPNGIDVYLADMHLHAVPTVASGAFALTDIDLDEGASSIIFKGSAIESGFVQGMNDALANASLTPISVQTTDDQMTIGCKTGNPVQSARRLTT